MYKIKKIFIILLITLLIMGIADNVNSAELKTKLETIQKSSETINLENDQGYISKTIVDSNADTGEITIELKISNTKKEIERNKYTGTDVVFVIDNSGSMRATINGTQTRRDVVVESVKEFTNAFFKDVNNLRVGLVYYASETKTNSYEYDATYVLSELTNDENEIQNGLNQFETIAYYGSTNTDAGLQTGKSLLDSNDNTRKFIVLLTDGIPNYAYDDSGKEISFYYTIDDQGRYQVNYDKVFDLTKQTIYSLENDNINLITILTGINDSAELEDVFGTVDNPTYGWLYDITDAEIKTRIEEEVYKNILEIVQTPLNDIKIVDYFPQDIMDNFEFSYVEKPDKGTVSDTIDKNNKTITWNIDSLKDDETATLKYKLKIKDMSNSDLLKKTLSTNEKVLLTYKDIDLKDYTIELTSSPKIQLSEVKEEKKPQVEPEKDPTVADEKFPNAGTNIKIAIVSIFTISVCTLIIHKKYKNNKAIK